MPAAEIWKQNWRGKNGEKLHRGDDFCAGPQRLIRTQANQMGLKIPDPEKNTE